MPNIRVDLDAPVVEGQSLTFRSPADCSQVSGLVVYYHENNQEVSKSFLFADAHGNNVGSIDLFAEDVLVKVVLDTERSRAYVQNADTNAYLEGRFSQFGTKASYAVKEAGWARIAKLLPNCTMNVFQLSVNTSDFSKHSELLIAAESNKNVHIFAVNDDNSLFNKARIVEENTGIFFEVDLSFAPKNSLDVAVFGKVSELYEVYTEGYVEEEPYTGKTISGRWWIDDTPGLTGSYSQDVNFTFGAPESSQSASNISWGYGAIGTIYYSHKIVYDTDDYHNETDSYWKDSSYQKIDFGPTPQPVSDDFYYWLEDNASYEGGGAEEDDDVDDESVVEVVAEVPIYHDYPMINRPISIDGTKIAKDCFDDVMVASGDGMLMHYADEDPADKEGWYRVAKMSTKTVATFHFNTSNAIIQTKGIFTVIGCKVNQSIDRPDDYSDEPVITQIAYKKDIRKYDPDLPSDCGIPKIRVIYGCTDENPVRPEEAEVMYLEVYRHKNGGNAIYMKAIGSTIEVPESNYEVPAIQFFASDHYYPAGEVPEGAKEKVFVFKDGAFVTDSVITDKLTVVGAINADSINVGNNKVLDMSDVDAELDNKSTNPVQNKVVKAGIDQAAKNVRQVFTTGGTKHLLFASANNSDVPTDPVTGFVYKREGAYYNCNTDTMYVPKLSVGGRGIGPQREFEYIPDTDQTKYTTTKKGAKLYLVAVQFESRTIPIMVDYYMCPNDGTTLLVPYIFAGINNEADVKGVLNASRDKSGYVTFELRSYTTGKTQYISRVVGYY